MVAYNGIVNIVSLVLYSIYLGISIHLVLRHGVGKSIAWASLAIFSLCRLVQASLDLAATEMFPPASAPNTSLESGVAILTEIGLTPLFMATTSLLNSTSNPKGRRMAWILLLLGIPLLISLVLIVAGGIDPDSRDGPTFAATDETKAGVALYCAAFIVLVWSTAIISARLYLADPIEIKILTTVVLSLPFFTVDVVYYMCFAFESLLGSQRFNVISGSTTLQLCMQVLEEYVIVALYLGLGCGIPDKAARLGNAISDFEYNGEFLIKLHRFVTGEKSIMFTESC